MQFKSILVVAMAALLCVPAMAQKKGKKAAKGKKAVAAAVLTPALKSVDGKIFSQGKSYFPCANKSYSHTHSSVKVLLVKTM